ncbi:FMN reductase [Lapillicoccus jejuensis]|uniref:FMN reductase n=1 Tax=Lapillicoccus jejuensis TaxID=402171 RepID=A0A542E4Y1_9MICO|nr:FMN reductase [Lapillicoccus jejuensis]TQJ10403.1 FMN reductase [Lapillicoccus jejuensis]
MTTRTLAVVSAGLSQPSSTRLLADRLAAATADRLREQGDDVVLETVDLRDLAHDVTNAMLTGFPSEALEAAQRAVTGADGLVAVTPIFSASYSGLFKSFVDTLEMGSLAGMPVLLGATGGTARHSLALDFALRPLFAYLRASVAPTAVFAATDDWASAASNGLGGRITAAGAEFGDLLAGSARRAPADPFADVVPFERLLRGEA